MTFEQRCHPPGDGPPNLDAMCESDLVRFLTTEYTDDEVRAMVGAAPNGAPRRGLLGQITYTPVARKRTGPRQ